MRVGKLPVQGRHTNLDNSRARTTALVVGAVGVGFFSCLSFLFSFSLSGRRPNID